MKLLASFLTLLVSMATTFALKIPVTGFGGCPMVPSQSPFNLSEYLGKWYSIEGFPDPYEEGRCLNAEYTIKENGKMNVLNSKIEKDGSANSIVGEASVPDPSDPAVLSVTFESLPITGEYRVVETDYTHYSLVTSCYDFKVVHVKYAWILSRDLTLPQSTVDKLKNRLAKIGGFPVSKFEPADQTDCNL